MGEGVKPQESSPMSEDLPLLHATPTGCYRDSLEPLVVLPGMPTG
jgi:hypothetical protein